MLSKTRNWAATILINGRIMSLYLWHLTAMVALIGGSLLLDGWGLRTDADTAAWWLTRPLWMAALIAATLPFLLVFGRYERPHQDLRPPPPAWRPLLAVVATCAGLGLLAKYGIADADGLNGIALSLPFAAAIAGGIGGARIWERRHRRRPGLLTKNPRSRAGNDPRGAPSAPERGLGRREVGSGLDRKGDVAGGIVVAGCFPVGEIDLAGVTTPPSFLSRRPISRPPRTPPGSREGDLGFGDPCECLRVSGFDSSDESRRLA